MWLKSLEKKNCCYLFLVLSKLQDFYLDQTPCLRYLEYNLFFLVGQLVFIKMLLCDFQVISFSSLSDCQILKMALMLLCFALICEVQSCLGFVCILYVFV